MQSTVTPSIVIAPELAKAIHELPTSDTTIGHAATACLDCGTPVADRYCGHCGQDAHHTHRFTMRYLLLHDLPHSVWHVDKGLLYTLRMMLTQPGRTIAQYLAGRRAQHFRPIAYLLLIGGLGALIMSRLQLQPLPADKLAEMPKVIGLAMERYMNITYKYPSLIYAVLLPVSALISRWFLRATRYNYAELLIAQAFITGTLTVPALLITGPMMWLSQHYPNTQQIALLGVLPTVAYPTWVYLQLLAHTPRSTAARWVRALGTACLQFLVLAVASFCLFIYFAVSMVNQDPALKADFKEKLSKKPKTAQVMPSRP